MMSKKIISLLGSLLVAVAVTFAVLNCFSVWLDGQLAELDSKQILLNNGAIEKDQGLYLLQRSVRHGDLFLIGSSELSSPVPQNPISLFPNQDLPVQIDKVGRAHKQSLLDGIMLGALSVDENTKMAMVVSMQWFYGEDVDAKGTQSNFSEVQYYAFMHNTDISEECKQYASARLAKLLAGESQVGAAQLYAKLHETNNIFSVIGRGILYPYYEGKYQLLLLKDKYNAYKLIKDAKEETFVAKNIDWREEQAKATEMGKEKCTNNNLYVYDEYYDKYLAPRWDSLKDGMSKELLLTSKEKEDYQFFLKIAQAKQVKPYMIFMSANGWYYDYQGLIKDKRYALYDWLVQETAAYGINYFDTRDYEYKPYFYCDVMHLGWKGWLYVGENISKHFGK